MQYFMCATLRYPCLFRGTISSEASMLNKRITLLATISALLVGVQSHRAENAPTSGLYQIISGRYIACCGIAGPVPEMLPDARDAFIELKVDPQSNLAQMKILGQDMQTVLAIPEEACRGRFEYVFINGTVFSDHIQFGSPILPPLPGLPSFNFVISNGTSGLSMNGTVSAPCPGGADVPELFTHTNVVATAVSMPAPTIRVSEVELCWQTASNRNYQVQYRTNLATNGWANLGSPVAGNGSTSCITDKLSQDQPQRYYRVVTLP